MRSHPLHPADHAPRGAEETAGYRVPEGARGFCEDALERHAAYIREHGRDMPEVVDWGWR